MTRQEWKYLHRIVRITWRESQAKLEKFQLDLLIYGIAVMEINS